MVKKRKTILFSIFTMLAITIISSVAIQSISKTVDKIIPLTDIDWDI